MRFMILCSAAQLFFAKVLRSANEEEVRQLFNKFGRVIEVNLFRAFQVSPAATYTGMSCDGRAWSATSLVAACVGNTVSQWAGPVTAAPACCKAEPVPALALALSP